MTPQSPAKQRRLQAISQHSATQRRLQAISQHFTHRGEQNSAVRLRMAQKTYNSGSDFPPLKPGVLRIYSMSFCPWAQRTRLVLGHKHIPHETINIDLLNKPSWFLEKSPQGLVPVLELDDQIMFESSAICDWLDDVYPDNRLQPADPYTRAWDRIVTEYYGKLSSGVYMALRSIGDQEQAISDFQKHYTFFEHVLEQRKGPFFGDDKPAMVDYLIWPHFERVQVLASQEPRFAVDNDTFPRLAAWFEAAQALPAVRATAFAVKTHVQFLESYMAGKPDYSLGAR